MTAWSVKVDREEFAKALRDASYGVSKNSTFELRLELSPDGLEISGLGTTMTLPASGDWPAAVLLSGVMAKNLAAHLPNVSPFVLAVEEGRLKIGGFSIAVKVLDIAPKRVDLVVNATSRDVLLAVARNGLARTAGSIGKKTVEDAQTDLSNAAARAYHAVENFGVTRQEVAAMLEASLKRQASGAR